MELHVIITVFQLYSITISVHSSLGYNNLPSPFPPFLPSLPNRMLLLSAE